MDQIPTSVIQEIDPFQTPKININPMYKLKVSEYTSADSNVSHISKTPKPKILHFFIESH